MANRPKMSSPTRAQIAARDAQPGEVDGRVGRAAADIQDQLVDRDQLAGPGQMVERRADMVGHDQPGTDDRSALCSVDGDVETRSGTSGRSRRDTAGRDQPLARVITGRRRVNRSCSNQTGIVDRGDDLVLA